MFTLNPGIFTGEFPIDAKQKEKYLLVEKVI